MALRMTRLCDIITTARQGQCNQYLTQTAAKFGQPWNMKYE
jgi:hypothetical protein